MGRRKQPSTVELSDEELRSLKERITSSNLPTSDADLLIKALHFMLWLQGKLQHAQISLHHLRQLFGITRKHPRDKNKAKDNAPTEDSDMTQDGIKEEAATPLETSAPVNDNDAINHHSSSGLVDEAGNDASLQPKCRGGRYGADAYEDAERVSIRHPLLSAGDDCPESCGGRLYEITPGSVIKIVGQGLGKTLHYEQEKLRCTLCGLIFTAALPATVSPDKYDARFKALLALQKYYLGVPFHATERLQTVLNQPLPDATQWMLVEQVADASYRIYDHLIELTARGTSICYDDTRVKVLSHLKHVLNNPSLKRKACYTTVIIGHHQQHPITLFFSSPKHAGENVGELLNHRAKTLPPILTMSDALAANVSHSHETVVCHCLAHALRKFTQIEAFYPDECAVVQSAIRQIYQHDATTLAQGMSSDERLAYHQEHSSPIMTTLKQSLIQQEKDKVVEPNSHLGQAIRYTLKHWQALTQFLRVPGALIDNNPSERALKLPIRTRKMAMFHRTEHGAYVAGLLMSLIQTCFDNEVNPITYLTALQDNQSAVFQSPTQWLPWNYPSQQPMEIKAA